MSSIEALTMYAATTALVCFIPGPAALMVTSTAASFGKNHVPAAISGICVANAVFFSLFGLGFLNLIMQSPTSFQILRWAGILYLIFLGAQMLLTGGHTPAALSAKQDTKHQQARIFAKAFTIQALNPKSILYFAALLPQFIIRSEPLISQIAVFCLITLLFDVLAYSMYGVIGIGFVKVAAGRLITVAKRFAGAIFLICGDRLIAW